MTSYPTLSQAQAHAGVVHIHRVSDVQWDAYEAGDILPTAGADPAADLMAAVVQAVQDRLDAFARTRGYDGILSACTYVASAVPKFTAEGQYCVAARDAHWAKCYEILGDVQAGTRPMPTLEEAIAELPALAWPA